MTTSSLTVGPSTGELTLLTGVEGRAAKLGHRLTIVMTDWTGTLVLDGDTPLSVELVVRLAGLEVRSGAGGLKPLSDGDRKTIYKSALETLRAADHPELRVVSTAIDPGHVVHADVTLHGVTQAVEVQVAVDGRHVTATTSLKQSTYGIRPYSQAMGSLKVSDEVQVRLELDVP